VAPASLAYACRVFDAATVRDAYMWNTLRAHGHSQSSHIDCSSSGMWPLGKLGRGFYIEARRQDLWLRGRSQDLWLRGRSQDLWLRGIGHVSFTSDACCALSGTSTARSVAPRHVTSEP
jgi:hypothetical protein